MTTVVEITPDVEDKHWFYDFFLHAHYMLEMMSPTETELLSLAYRPREKADNNQ